MAEEIGAIVTFTVLTLCLMGTVLGLCGFHLEVPAFDIVKHPLEAVWNLTSIFTVWNIVGYTSVAFSSGSLNKITAKNVFGGTCLCLGSAVMFHIALVVFGAPATKNVAETFHLASLLATLVALPCLVVCGLSISNLARVFLSSNAVTTESNSELTDRGLQLATTSHWTALEQVVWWSSVCTVAGVWLGAVPIPLDWDRPWQVWPIPCSIGALLGHAVGLACGSVELAIKMLTTKMKEV